MASTFQSREAFLPRAGYRLLPLRFDRLDGDAYLVTNDVGDYLRVDRASLEALVHHRLDPRSDVYRALKARHFLYDSDDSAAFELLPLAYRTRAEPLAASTGLHLFVVTLRCDLSCQYCQVSRRGEAAGGRFDMSAEHAERAIDFMFRSPNRDLKVEFQGGEPLLHFERVAHVVERVEALNAAHGRNVQFVIASNLSRLDDEVLSFCRRHDVHFSTSLDGPADLHDAQRPARGASSHALTVAGIERVRRALGPDRVAALMTTTPASLDRVEEIVDEYVRLGLPSVFLRSLSPYGYAARSLVRRYGVDDWLRFYRRGLAHVLRVNAAGRPLREDYTAVLLQKIFCPAGARYVDLQSPAGIGIGAVVYNYDGSVYASDEGRMLAEMGDESFRLGHLDRDTYEAMMTSEALLGPLTESLLESAPGCSDCAFLPYCGADPVYHRLTQGDALGHKAFSDFCAKQMGALRHVFSLLEGDAPARETLLAWV
ncbi:MAG: His-Xaa-Ser system radical SAM maturase HxsB [Polyangiales bacterium]